ncbi:hypothetical protein BST81_01525 [Leptolyngbya sp. 'hensonii']|uniref:PAS domain S-box protein n=1 Tax=Leptolyngbya sp. 'hensonii' TaxID=1922337 RepID=UPI00094F842A|nr:PAS domain S-box protein [Leptolyngbya sp. 'hensonii']OLP20142.1 hypothetical protein BST81_01525 [Leptolyngbya sp. 'hensonii']
MDPIKILLVGEDADGPGGSEHQIQEAGYSYEITIATSLAAAQLILTRQNFDIAILDHRWEWPTLEVWPDLQARQIPVILAVQPGQDDIALQFLQQGIQDYLIKDSDRKDYRLLPLKIYPVLRAWQTQQALEKAQRELQQYQQAALVPQPSQELHRRILDQISDAVFVTDDRGKFTFISPAVADLFGYSTEDVAQMGTIDLLIGMALFDRTQLIAEGEIKNLERDILDKFGKPHTLLISVKRVCINGGTVLYTCRDITERRQTEIALSAHEACLQTIVFTSTTGLVVVDLDGQILLANPAAEKMLGKTSENLVGQPFGIPAIRDGQIQEVGLLQPNHRCRFAEMQTAEIEWEKQSAYLISMADITARKQAEEKLYHLNQELERRVIDRTIELEQANIQLHREMDERTRIDQELQHINQFLTLVMDNVPQRIFWKDRNLVLLGCNRTFALDVGLSPEEIVGKSSAALSMTPEEVDRYHTCDLQVMESGEPQLHQIETLHRSDGSYIWIETNKIPLRNAEGSIIGLLGTYEDITIRREAESALQESEARYRRIVETAGEGIWILDAADQTIFVNEKMAQMLGVLPEDLLGHNLSNFMDQESQQLAEAHLDQRHQGLKEQYDFKFRRRDGSDLWTIIEATPILDESGHYAGTLKMVMDISDRKQMEDTLQQQLEKEQLLISTVQRIRDSLNLDAILRTTVEEVQQLIQADRVLVYQLFEDGTGKAVAESGVAPWQQVLNISFPAEAFPPSCYQRYVQGETYIINDRDQDPVLDCMTQFMQDFDIQAKLVVPIVQQENEQLWGLLIAHHCSQARQWQEWEVNLLQQLASQLAVGIKQSELYYQLQAELGERKQVEANLQAANDQLQIMNRELARATRLKDEFLANMSHELRTPLNAILGLSEGLLDELFGPLNEKQKKFMATVERSGRHLLDLINDILDLAKIEAGKLELDKEIFSVRGLCDACMPFVKQQALKKDIQLNLEIPATLTPIEADERRMKQVLINLLTNAVKFTPQGGRVTLRVRQTVPPPSSVLSTLSVLIFEVEDSGIGIAPEDMDKLFQSFSQIDSGLSRSQEGTGLGLALVKRIIELHGGKIEVASEVEKGSRFTVSLPYLPPEGNWQPAPESQLETTQGAETLVFFDQQAQGPLVLLAEDNEANVATIVPYLEAIGCRILLAANGVEAIEKTKAHRPELILMDIHMPQLDGLEAIRRIRADSEIAHTPIIALTALAMAGDREKCIAAGANEYITKPIQLKQLVMAMAVFLQV